MKVYFNGSCNICNAEINHYKKIKNEIEYVDISEIKDEHVANLSKDKLFRRMHVYYQGTLYSGSESFLIMWSQMKNWRILSRILSLPIMRQIWYLVYEIAAIFLYWKNKSKV
ncbi:DUF393 domain-containing protein [Alphaproteobacteria bacterium]|jgi:predicted DCC family thiol-disulfide oxidoreductase YuxK|nr:DUF393 domain-containing protein [Alphaproteobacteria bacterium]|tara:strand:- start:211 stop:546 length:336 start_codon:yes stop_codon:yes gene_type:complete